jgi:hypothetical protein
MKHTSIPAQITTVEDKLAGGLTLQQLTLLTIPIPVCFMLYSCLPGFFRLSPYKLILMVFVTMLFCLSAIKVHGKILLYWLRVITKYNHRPRFYTFNKNTPYLREYPTYPSSVESQPKQTTITQPAITLKPEPADSHILKTSELLSDQKLSLSFKTNKRGSLYVYVAKV